MKEVNTMIKRNLLKATLLTTVIATLLTATACGKKTANNTTTDSTTAITTEAKSVAVNDTKTGLVTFDYTDADGNTYTLEGKAVADEKGDATIEVTDANGNKVIFTGKSTTTDGKLSVSDIAVKNEGTLVKADGSEIKVTAGTTVAEATESTGENTSDIAASDDVKNEIETAKKEENKDIVSDNKEEDVVIADNSDNSSSDKGENNTPVSTPDVKEEEKNDTPAPAPTEKEEDNTPASTPEPEPTPSVPEETPTEAPTEAPTERATHMETKYIYFHDFNGGIYGTDSVTYLAYEDGTPVEETTYSHAQAREDGIMYFPKSEDPDKFVIGWYLIDKPSYVTEEVNEKIFHEINLADYPGNVHMYPGWI